MSSRYIRSPMSVSCWPASGASTSAGLLGDHYHDPHGLWVNINHLKNGCMTIPTKTNLVISGMFSGGTVLTHCRITSFCESFWSLNFPKHRLFSYQFEAAFFNSIDTMRKAAKPPISHPSTVRGGGGDHVLDFLMGATGEFSIEGITRIEDDEYLEYLNLLWPSAGTFSRSIRSSAFNICMGSWLSRG